MITDNPSPNNQHGGWSHCVTRFQFGRMLNTKPVSNVICNIVMQFITLCSSHTLCTEIITSHFYRLGNDPQATHLDHSHWCCARKHRRHNKFQISQLIVLREHDSIRRIDDGGGNGVGCWQFRLTSSHCFRWHVIYCTQSDAKDYTYGIIRNVQFRFLLFALMLRAISTINCWYCFT